MEYEELLLTNEFSEIIRAHNQALDRIQRFREGYPYLAAPNMYEFLEHNLKENIGLLYRELQGLKKEKKVDPRFVCQNCKAVFTVSLPGGLCDECRGKMGPGTPT